MSLSNANQTYPPSIADCPDNYSLNGKFCVAGSNINVVDRDISCVKVDFTSSNYSISGTGSKSGSCAKKLWANQCQVKWDGITNNDNLCYTDFETSNTSLKK
jgi:hypothetical protein